MRGLLRVRRRRHGIPQSLCWDAYLTANLAAGFTGLAVPGGARRGSEWGLPASKKKQP
jgi:hypothetical protein